MVKKNLNMKYCVVVADKNYLVQSCRLIKNIAQVSSVFFATILTKTIKICTVQLCNSSTNKKLNIHYFKKTVSKSKKSINKNVTSIFLII